MPEGSQVNNQPKCLVGARSWKIRMLQSPLFPATRSTMSEDARQNAEDHYYLALDLVTEGQHEAALVEYQKSLDADPGFTEAMHGMARALQDLNRLDDAIAMAKRIAEI